MSEEYREYRRRRASAAVKTAKKHTFPKKLGYQTAISLALLIAVCTLNFFNNAGAVNTYIKSAVLYQPDTSALSDIFANILDLYTEEGNNNEKNTITKSL